MDTLPFIEVKPVYGYGWFVGGAKCLLLSR
jgi:hypothetical protein